MNHRAFKPETTQRIERLRKSYERGTISQDVLRNELISTLMTHEGMLFNDADATAFEMWMEWGEEAHESGDRE